MNNKLWEHYRQLNKAIPIVIINYLDLGVELVMYDWDNWDDFFNKLSEYIIKLNNIDGIYIIAPKKIYKRNDLLRTLRKNVRFIFFKGHRVYTHEELYWIESKALFYPFGKKEINNNIFKFYLKEAMEVKFDDLIHYIR